MGMSLQRMIGARGWVLSVRKEGVQVDLSPRCRWYAVSTTTTTTRRGLLVLPFACDCRKNEVAWPLTQPNNLSQSSRHKRGIKEDERLRINDTKFSDKSRFSLLIKCTKWAYILRQDFLGWSLSSPKVSTTPSPRLTLSTLHSGVQGHRPKTSECVIKGFFVDNDRSLIGHFSPTHWPWLGSHLSLSFANNQLPLKCAQWK